MTQKEAPVSSKASFCSVKKAKLCNCITYSSLSEYNECYGSPGLSGIIRRLVERVKDMDPLAHEHIHQCLYAATRQAPGGVNQQAIAAIENALLDIKGQALDIPVYDILGGAIRKEIPVYWSHCGTSRTLGDHT